MVPDLAVPIGKYHAGALSILLGNGDGTLQPVVVETIGPGPWDTNVRDIDGDGNSDLVVSCRDGWGGIAIALGNGDGTFQDPDAYAGQEGCHMLAVGDLNADSRMDVVVGHKWSDNISIFINIFPDTPVEYAFYATALEDGSIMVRWGLELLADAQALRLYRATSADGPFRFLGEQALPASLYGEFSDTTVWPRGTFWYDLRAVLWDGQEESIAHPLPSATVGGTLSLAMHQPRAIPFTAQCAFAIDVPNHTGNVHLAVYNVRGQLVSTLIDEPLARGARDQDLR